MVSGEYGLEKRSNRWEGICSGKACAVKPGDAAGENDFMPANLLRDTALLQSPFSPYWTQTLQSSIAKAPFWLHRLRRALYKHAREMMMR